MNYKSSNVRIVEPYPLWRCLKVKENDAGHQLLELLRMRFPFISTQEWERRIANGWINIDGSIANGAQVVKKNQTIGHYNPRVREPSVPDELQVLQEHKDWLLIWKPAPMPVHAGGRYYKNTAQFILQERGYEDVKVVHRLDSVTSGVMLFGRNKEAVSVLQNYFKSGDAVKEYLALVAGEPENDYFVIDRPVRRKKGFIFECAEAADSKHAVTEVEVLERLNGYSIVKAKPLTGRTHQIRLHLKTAGYPIADDPIYGPEGDQSGLRLQNSPIRLVSCSLKIEKMGINSELESDPEWKCYHRYYLYS